MTYDPDRHHRRSIRLQGYDYTRAGAYFVTLCTKDGSCLFGEGHHDEVRLTPAGWMVAEEWDALPTRFPSVELDAYVVMPNHVHGIIVLCEPPIEEGARPRTGGLSGRPNAEASASEARTGGPCGRPNAGDRAAPQLAMDGAGAACPYTP